MLISGLLLAVRSLGILEAWELKAYDHLIQLRPDEGPEPPLLIISVTENDIQAQEPEQRKGWLSDAALAQLLEKHACTVSYSRIKQQRLLVISNT